MKMTDSVVIKTVKNYGEIRLADTTRSEMGIVPYIVWVGIAAVGYILFLGAQSYDVYLSGASMIGVGLLVIFVVVHLIFVIGIKSIPAYRVYTVCDTSGNQNIYIDKTKDVGADQKSICKAAQELEGMLEKEYEEYEKLKAIAARCK